MNSIPGTITEYTSLTKRADALVVGDVIPGGDAVNGHAVERVEAAMDPMLGLVTVVTVRMRPAYPEDETHYVATDYIFRPYDRIYVER